MDRSVSAMTRHPEHKVTSPNGFSNYPVSAAALMDPRIMKQQMANGTPSSLFEPSNSYLHSGSEPLPIIKYPLTAPSDSDINCAVLSSSKDDAYTVFKGKGKMSQNQSTMHLPNGVSSARQLLDPKNHNKEGSYKGDLKTPPNATASPLSSFHKPINDGSPESSSDSKSVQGQKHGGSEEQGIGNLIERLHGISEREERPFKKRKVERDSDFEGEKKATFRAKRQGGELGEYVKQKKKEGLADPEAVRNVVDLTEGMSSMLLTKRPRPSRVCGSHFADLVQAMIPMK